MSDVQEPQEGKEVIQEGLLNLIGCYLRREHAIEVEGLLLAHVVGGLGEMECVRFVLELGVEAG